MRRTAVLVTGAAGSVLIAAAVASAAPGDTTVTFINAGGSVAITVPGSASLSSTTAVVGGTATGNLGTVSISDTRIPAVSSWTVSASSTAFTGSLGGTIANTAVSITAGSVTGSAGLSFTQNATPHVLSSAQSVVVAAGSSTNATASFNPTLSVTVGAASTPGTYTGTVTETVA